MCDVVIFKGTARLISDVIGEAEADGSNVTIQYSALPAGGDYGVSLECEGLRTRTKPVVAVAAGASTLVDFGGGRDLTTGIGGTVLDGAGVGLADVFVYVRSLAEGAPAAVARTDAAGQFQTLDLEAGVYSLDVGGAMGLARVNVRTGAVSGVSITYPPIEAESLVQREQSPSSLSAIRTRAASSDSAPATWPWSKPPVLPKCGTATSPTSAYYQEKLPIVRRAFEQGVPCLAEKMPKVAHIMKQMVDPDVPAFLSFMKKALTYQLVVEFDCAPTGKNECARVGLSPMVSLFVTLTTRAGSSACGCMEATIFHEFMHKAYGAMLECPEYACAHDCFECAIDVIEDPDNPYSPDERCDCKRPCKDYKDWPKKK